MTAGSASAEEGEPVLVGDVGGTHARFAIAHPLGDGGAELSDFIKLPGDDYRTFDDALGAYCETLPERPKAAAFAFAGPVRGDTVALTNRDWRIEGAALSQRLGFASVGLFNDFAAMARGAAAMPESSFEPIKPGEAVAGAPVLVAGPGTGFGMATLIPMAGDWYVLEGEGGHQAYAAETQLEWELAQALRRKAGFVSVELVSAGRYLDDVFEALAEAMSLPYEKLPPQEILRRAEEGDALATAMCELRAAATMTALGDAAVANGARGGAVLAGGVAERLAPWLKAPKAVRRFTDRGPMTAYTQAIPVKLLTDGAAPLIGAAKLFQRARLAS